MHAERSRPLPTPQENEKPTELLGAADIGLQARLLVGELSDPQVAISKKRLRPIKDAGAQGITEQVSRKYQKASLTQRRRHQEETGLTYTRWRDGFNTYLGTIREDTAHGERKIFLETLGISSSITADDFYREYLSGKSDVVKFVDTVETSATREQIQKHEDIIRQLGNAFGYESSEVIDHLIHGIRNVKDDISGFTRQASQQVNTAKVRSNPLLSRIEEDGKGEEQILGARPEEKEVPKKAVPAKETGPSKAEPRMATRYKATPIKKVNLEEEPEPRPPKKKERAKKQTPKAVQVYPAPIREEKRDEGLLMTNAELATAVDLLSDDDRLDRAKQVTVLRESEIMNHYARELHATMEEYGRDFVLERAEIAVQRLQSIIQKIGLKSDKRSRSQSWYLVGIAKARFLAENVDPEKRPNAEVYDPLLHYLIGTNTAEGQQSYAAEEAIINDVLGWEVYRQRKKVLDILSHLDPFMSTRDKNKLKIILARAPKEASGTLPSSQLREIGKLVRDHIPRR